MARWNNKGRAQGFAIPLDALVKEKENTNRPIASRSAGTVGKWGTTSFTSIRTSSYGLQSFSPKQEILSNCGVTSPSSEDGNSVTKSLIPDVPKPKKFFKSRNVPEVLLPAIKEIVYTQTIQQQQQQQKPEPKKTKKSVKKEEGSEKVQLQKHKKPVKVKEKIKKKEVEKPTRLLSRSRKTINYSENLSRTPSPVFEPSTSFTSSGLKPPTATHDNNSIEDLETTNSHNTHKPVSDHPPIVLRISKGTSRLVSTDSEEVISSPPTNVSLSPPTPSQQQPTPSQQQPNETVVQIPDEQCKGLKIKIKQVTNKETYNIAKEEVDEKEFTTMKPSTPPPVEENIIQLIPDVPPEPIEEPPEEISVVPLPSPSPPPLPPAAAEKENDVLPISLNTDPELPLENTDEQVISNTRFTRTQTRPNRRKVNSTTSSLTDNSKVVVETPRPAATRSYGRKRKLQKEDTNSLEDRNSTSTTLPIDKETNMNPIVVITNLAVDEPSTINEDAHHIVEDNISNNNIDIDHRDEVTKEAADKPSVKLVISKKKGSIFKSRAIETNAVSGEATKQPKRHLYKHKWDNDEKDKSNNVNNIASQEILADFEDEGESSSKTFKRQAASPQHESLVEFSNIDGGGIGGGDNKRKPFYTVVRNVKKAHQIQEIGEFQEMDDDVEYILDALKSHNPMATRCLSAIQLASKCMTPAFRMHVRAHGTITKFFKALNDATNTQSLGLCTATVMFVLNQDNLNMDLDRDSLGLMLNLLESDVSHRNALDNCGLTKEQLQRNKEKVRELCSLIKGQGKAVHLNLDNITVGTLAMETLLSLTSKRAGEWFKEELRNLGGLEKIIETICECCKQISDYVVVWTEVLLDKLRKIERCLRVLENVSTQNEENQKYILSYKNGYAVNSFIKFYELCDKEIALYPTTDETPKENPGVVLREALLPTLKVLINLTHPFSETAFGSRVLGEQTVVFDTSLHLLLEVTHYVPERCIFELNILVLLLLINLTTYTISNRTSIMDANAPSDFGNQFNKVPAIKALIEYFYKCEELARLAELNTDAILDNPAKLERKHNNQDDVEETVSKLLQKAGHHMEHTMLGSYVCLLIGYLIMNNEKHEAKVRTYLKDASFKEMVKVLEKYYSFINLTASSESSSVSHIKQTKRIIDYFQNCDSHSILNNKKEASINNSSSRQSSRLGQNAAAASTDSFLTSR